MTTRLETVSAVVDTLYGTAASMARDTNRSRTAIWKYQQRGQFPGDLYREIQARARLMDCEIPNELFTPVSVHPSRVKEGA